MPLALSSTAQVLPWLRAENELNTPQGERAFSILLFQDLAVIPLITIVAAMAPAPDPSAPTGWKLVLLTLLAVAGLVAFGRLVLNPLFRLIGRLGERELFVVAGLFTVVGASALMRQFDLSVSLGAFVAGVVLAELPYRHELESDVEPFRSIFLGLFFLSVGMLLDLRPDRVAAAARDRPRGGGDRHQDDPHHRSEPSVRQFVDSKLPARAAAQPGRRVRLRPVRPGHGRAARSRPKRPRCSARWSPCRWSQRHS